MDTTDEAPAGSAQDPQQPMALLANAISNICSAARSVTSDTVIAARPMHEHAEQAPALRPDNNVNGIDQQPQEQKPALREAAQPEARALRIAKVKAGMQAAQAEMRSVARRVPFGYRLGRANGPFLNAVRQPLGKKGRYIADQRRLVPNRREMEILDAIIAGMRKFSDLTPGQAAYRVAKTLNQHGVKNPRGNTQWHAGSVKSIYATAMKRRAAPPATLGAG